MTDIDLFSAHVELSLCESILERRLERTGEDTLSPETISALQIVTLVGPGLTLGNPEVDKLEERRFRYNRDIDDKIPIRLQDGLSRAMSEASAVFGRKIVEYQGLMPLAPVDPANRVRVSQGILNKNAIIFSGLFMTSSLAAGSLGQLGAELTVWLSVNRELILAFAQYWGQSFSHWMSLIMANVPEIAEAARLLRGRPRN